MDLSVREEYGYTIFIVKGKIEWSDAQRLDRTISQYLGEGKSRLVCILDEVTFVCSGGIGVFVYNLNKARQKGGALYLIANNDYINFLFDTLKFNIVFEGLLFDSFKEFQREVIAHSQGKNAS